MRDTDEQRQLSRRHRTDIQVLRAFAVGIVVLYHLNTPLFDAGFIGVDVFFVISGYLISRILLLEIGDTGRVHLARFTARRVQRLLPMSVLVLVVTAAAIRVRESTLTQLDELPVARGAATYRVNFTLAGRETDYLTADQVSPFQHYWSLAVEEQFYVILPVTLFALAAVFGKRRSLAAASSLFVVASVATFVLAMIQTTSNPPEAFFLLHTRAWEFAAGGLIAAAELAGRRPISPQALRWLGLGVLVLALAATHRIDFPGPGAAIAVVGTALMIWAGVGPATNDLEATSWGAARWVGDRSYSLYLWHWPPIVLLDLDGQAFGERTALRVAVVVGAVVASAVSHRWVETWFRTTAPLRTTVRALGFLVAATALAYLIVGLLLDTSDVSTDGPPAQRVTLEQLAEGPPDSPAVAPSNLVPALLDARGDLPSIYDDDCHAELNATAPRAVADCSFGGSGQGGTVLLTGDSHAAQWFDAVDASARGSAARLVVATKSGCSITGTSQARFAEICESWRTNALDMIEELDPDVIVSSNVIRTDERTGSAEWAENLRTGIGRIRERAPEASIVLILDSPVPAQNIPTCIAERPPSGCESPRDLAFDDLQREVAGELADRVLDVNDLLCTEAICPPVIGDILVYRDASHLSRPVVQLLTPLVSATLAEAGLGSG